jgi:RNA polymerase sigma-70 factor, ECF subfamily
METQTQIAARLHSARRRATPSKFVVKRGGPLATATPAVQPPAVQPKDRTDEQLVAGVQAGDVRAFEFLVRKYQSRITYLLSQLVGESDAPDIAQETFIKAYRALQGFRGDSAFYTWLYRIAVNTAKNYLVSRNRRPASQDIDVEDAEQWGHTAQLSDMETPEAVLLSEEIRDKIAEVIESLPKDLRHAITLRELEGLSYEEIAETMGCPIGTVRSRIFRAREAIDAVVEPLVAA